MSLILAVHEFQLSCILKILIYISLSNICIAHINSVIGIVKPSG